MQGRRIDCPFDELGGLVTQWPQPGDYYFDPRAGWMAVTPSNHLGDLSNHDVVEHADRTITVSPSILVSGQGVAPWHGYLERGVWRAV